MKESVTIQYRCEDADTNLVETIPIASIGIDQWSQGHPVLFKPPKRERPPGKPWGGPKLSKQEIAEFTRIWNMPYSRLKYEKAPTMVGQGDEKQTLF